MTITKVIDRIPNWLRWILCIPTGFCVSLLIHFFIIVQQQFATAIFPVSTNISMISNILFTVISFIIAPACFILTSSAIAPRFKSILALLLAMFQSVLTGFLLWGKLMLLEQLSLPWIEVIMTAICVFVSCFIAAMLVFKKEHQPGRKKGDGSI